MRAHLFAASLLAAALAACSQQDAPAPTTSSHNAQSGARDVPSYSLAPRARASVARLPDRGNLLAYDATRAPKEGRHATWHPVELSEEHALRAITTGVMTLRTPDGGSVDVRYSRHQEDANGNWTWIGRADGAQAGQDTVVTFGERAVFGRIAGRDGRTYGITMSAGRTWLVQDKPGATADVAHRDGDFVIPTDAVARAVRGIDAPGLAGMTADVGAAKTVAVSADASAKAAVTVDLVLGYTTGYAQRLGGASQAETRLAYLVALANQAYAASQVDAQLRLVRAVQVGYSDTTSNRGALFDLTGVECTSAPGGELPDGGVDCTPAAIPAALQPLVDARAQYGGDLMAVVRPFANPQHGSCGIGWLLGGGQTPITSADAAFGVSVISDTSGSQFPDDGATCREETLAHELGHNMGLQHDRATARGNDDTNGDGDPLDPEEFGRYPYAFGYSAANFYTVMAVRRTGQTGYLVFSNPEVTACGGAPCGVADQADNARALRQTMPIVASFRATVVPLPGGSRLDLNGDGRGDVFWSNRSAGLADWWLMNGTTWTYGGGAGVASQYRVAARGDFDGDGRGDILWEDASTLYVWRSEAFGGFSVQFLSARPPASWAIVGAGDLNADGRDDIVWHNRDGQLADWWLMSGVTSWTYGGGAAIPSQYRMAAIGDSDGDGRKDLHWEDGTSLWTWRSQPAGGFAAIRLADYPAGWSIAGMGDLNADGRDDIVWRNAGVELADWWLMNGSTWTYGGGLGAAAPFRVAGVVDVDGDGRSDVLWEDGSAIWLWRSTRAGFAPQYLTAFPGGWTAVL